MTSNDVIDIYENLAGITSKMTQAAQAGDWASLARLERQCEQHQLAVQTGMPPLSGEARMRKIALLKKIMANDRAIREFTEPWCDVVLAAAAH